MDDLTTRTVVVIDNGLFTSLAVTLSESFGRTLYYSPWESPFPRSNALYIGDGYPKVQRVQSIWPLIDDIDLFVFPDIFHGELQVYLRKIGKRVWGSNLGQSLEFMRGFTKRTLRQIGLPVGEHRVLRGIDALRSHLQKHDDQFVKISRTRGDMETFHAVSYDLVEPRIAELEHSLGPIAAITEFVVEAPIDAKAEVGYDGFTVDGRYPSQCLFGVESKDAGYLGEVVAYSGLPRALGYVNQALSPLFRDLKYRGFWSSEIRIAKDNTPYLIDPCCRMASPPGELYQYLIENLADVIWHGAAGEIVEPEWRHKWGAQLILKSPWAEQNWQPITYPDDVADHVKLHFGCMVNGKEFIIPQPIEQPEIGSVVAGGSTKEEAIKAVTKIAEQVKGYDIKFDTAALDEAAAGMDKMRKAA